MQLVDLVFASRLRRLGLSGEHPRQPRDGLLLPRIDHRLVDAVLADSCASLCSLRITSRATLAMNSAE